MLQHRTLFILPRLPRPRVSVGGIAKGNEAVSGSVGSSLLVIERLAQRGKAVSVLVLGGQVLTDHSFPVHDDVSSAKSWVQDGLVVWCSWDDDLSRLNSEGLYPLKWHQTGLDHRDIRAVEQGRLCGIVVVSDLTRLSSLHSPAYKRIGRIYNPLNPFYGRELVAIPARYMSKSVVFAGYLGETKGAHRVLQAWLPIREQLPDATLTLAGSARLYGENRAVGNLGVADPEFETRYIQPLIERFGSLETSGIKLPGLLRPSELRELYARSALGFVNFNWLGDGETFCCTAVEMLATQLPVFSFAEGSLPETIGKTGGAILQDHPDLNDAADAVVELLRNPERLGVLGAAGRRYVCREYHLDRIAEVWERILTCGTGDLDTLSGPWAARRTLRYRAERIAGRFGVGHAYEFSLQALKRLRKR